MTTIRPAGDPSLTALARRAGGAIGATALLLGLGVGPAAAAPAQDDAGELLRLLNGERAAHGLAAVHPEATLGAGARSHADAMAAGGRLFHTAMTASAPAGWLRLGENVAVADDVPAAHRALLASPSHRAVILDPAFDGVGLAITHGAGSSHWVSMKFADRPGHPAPGSPPAETSVRGAGLASAGELAGVPLVAPIVGRMDTPSGAGHWLVAADGGVFSFGDARWHGSLGGMPLAAPIVGMAARPGGDGYWLAGADGGVFSFGAAPFLGAVAPDRPASPIVSIHGRSTGGGYALRTADGTRYGFGDAR